jgi:hypothetical protein
MSKRVQFCGSIAGSVAQRDGESYEEAVARAQQQLLALMTRSAKSLSLEGDSQGPNLELEIDEAAR